MRRWSRCCDMLGNLCHHSARRIRAISKNSRRVWTVKVILDLSGSTSPRTTDTICVDRSGALDRGNLRQGRLTRTHSMQQLMDVVNKLAHRTTEPGRSTSPAAEVMLAWVDDDGPIKQGGAAATEELLLEVVCKLSSRDGSGCLHIRCLVRGEVLLQPLAGIVASDIKGGRGPSLE